MNCGNCIPLDEIEQHSNVCTKVSEEMLKTETNKTEVYSISYKLTKLKEHLTNVMDDKGQGSNNIYVKEMSYISTVLLQYINDTLSYEKIDINNIKELKKILKNLETLSKQYKSSVANMVLIDRTKLLVKEKLKIFIQMYRVQIKTKQMNEQKKGSLDFENTMKEKQKEVDRLKVERE